MGEALPPQVVGSAGALTKDQVRESLELVLMEERRLGTTYIAVGEKPSAVHGGR